jgi:hypothetical protein
VRRAAVALAAALAALALAGIAGSGSAGAATLPGLAPTASGHDSAADPADSPLAPGVRLTSARAIALFLRHPKVADWLDRYPAASIVDDATLDDATGVWDVGVWSGDAGQIAKGRVDDATGAVTEAWTGPQVAWTMARGHVGSFGGDLINDPWLWLGLGIAFFVGLADLRRPFALRNLDLLVLLSLLGSLWLFNQGDIFAAMPAVYPPLAYLVLRLAWIGSGRRRGRSRRPDRPSSRPLWPVWLLAALALFAGGLRIGLNAADSNVIDVGYAGIIGAERIAHGSAPWGNFPRQDDLPECGPADAAGDVRDRIQPSGLCESANPRGDTYGPVAYLAYLPGYGVSGWDGKWATGRGWGELPAVHLTSVLWDVLTLLGLALVGIRFGGARLAATLCFAWATYPLTLYAFMSNTNDAIAPALLVLGFWLVTSPWARGATVALAGWTKLVTLVVAPLWAAYPEGLRPRTLLRFAGGFLAATAAAFAVLLLEPDVFHAARVFAERTFAWQLDRESPFSLWDWGQYRAAGLPDLKIVQHALQALLVAGALAVTVFPRGRRSPLQLAALTGALLVGMEAVLTHWSWLYVPWFFPFAALALLAPRHPRSEPAGAGGVAGGDPVAS